MTTEMNCLASGSSSQTAISKDLLISASANPTWNNAPFKANQVFGIGHGIYSGSMIQFYFTNFNPTTGAIDNSKVWVSNDGGNNWSQLNYGWTITDTSVSYSQTLSTLYPVYTTFVITDGEFEIES